MDLSHIYFCGTEEPRRACPQPTAVARPRPRESLRLAQSRSEEASCRTPDPFLAWLFQRGGLAIETYRASALERRLPACLRKLRSQTPDSARSLLEARPELIPAALDTVLIGVTEFFRDREVFTQLERQVLPELLAVKRRLRVLAAGVSHGQELYSVAMLLALKGALANCHLVGVDCRPQAIARSAAGIYTSAEVKGIETRFLDLFFERHGSNWVVVPGLRKQVHWREEDLRQCRGEEWDLILFRNVVIYMDEPAAAGLWRQLVSQLTPGGVLVTGKSERPLSDSPLQRLGPSLYARRT